MANYPQTYALYSNEISLPVYYGLTDQQLQRVIDAVISAVNKVL
jgi:dTDP-4-amino-4,6-dideoxygalactose transaminase